MKKRFINNLLKFLVIGFTPILILLIGYVVYDPFMIIHNYDNYSNPYVTTSRDYVSTEMYLKNHSKQHYNSFIFGSSRTIAFKPNTWKQKLSKNDHVFVFDAAGETLYGIHNKLVFLDSINAPIDNAIIIFCRDWSFINCFNKHEVLFIKHPCISHESFFDFHKVFLKAYFDPMFMYCFYNYTFTKVYKPYMLGYIEGRKITIDSISNRLCIVDQENEILHNPTKYYKEKADIFYERKGESIDTLQRINKKELIMLKRIKQILVKHHTKYKIVLSPLYDQMKFSRNDIMTLNNLFGKNIYDFTGKNAFTNDKHNYYEASHFRPCVGDSIINYIY